jgi:hypothetical protein
MFRWASGNARPTADIGVKHMPEFTILALLWLFWLFMIVARLGFSSGAPIIPVMISLLQEAQIPTPTVAGMIMLLTYATRNRLDSANQRAAKRACLRHGHVRSA